MFSYPLTCELLVLGSSDFFVLWIYPFLNSQPFALGLNYTTWLSDSSSYRGQIVGFVLHNHMSKFPWSPLACLLVAQSMKHHRLQPARLLSPWDSPGKDTGVGFHSLLQGIFLIQRSSLGLLHCRQIPYYLSHQESPYFLLFNSLYPIDSYLWRTLTNAGLFSGTMYRCYVPWLQIVLVYNLMTTDFLLQPLS